MARRTPDSPLLLALLLLLLLPLWPRAAAVFGNDGTEAGRIAAPKDAPNEEAGNRARDGGRRPAPEQPHGPHQSQVGCKELRSTKYISDGQCTSVNPLKELVCAGECLPTHLLPNWIGAGGHSEKYWSRRDTLEWRCVIDKTRTQRIRLQCQDGSSRTYKITMVTSCKCKRYSRQQNDSGNKEKAAVSEKKKKKKGQRKTGSPKKPTGNPAVISGPAHT